MPWSICAQASSLQGQSRCWNDQRAGRQAGNTDNYSFKDLWPVQTAFAHTRLDFGQKGVILGPSHLRQSQVGGLDDGDNIVKLSHVTQGLF